jgi:hypothetical protein
MMQRSSVYLFRFGTLTAFVILAIVASAQDVVVSEQCDTETNVLNNNTALQDVGPVLQCNINFDVSNNCTVDYAGTSTNYSNACREAGGQLYSEDILLDCNIDLGRQNYTGKLYYMNTPSCIGISCKGREIEMEFKNNLYPKLDEYYDALGAQCKISSDSSALPRYTAMLSSVAAIAIGSLFYMV